VGTGPATSNQQPAIRDQEDERPGVLGLAVGVP